MPTRPLRQPTLKWPDDVEVRRALERWARAQRSAHPELCRLGFFGSYARGDWGVGSDLDLVAVVTHCEEPFERRARTWATERLPVPADIVIYTEDEWHALLRSGTRFARTLSRETVWVFPRDED